MHGNSYYGSGAFRAATLTDGVTNMSQQLVLHNNGEVYFQNDINPRSANEALTLTTRLRISKLGVLTAGAGLAIGAVAVAGGFAAAAGSTLVSVGVGIAMMGLQMALAPKPKMERPSADVNSAKQSFIFSSKANVAEQGIPVPVGYGRLRVGSAVIQSTIKSYPQAFEKENSLASDGQIQTNDRLT